MTIRLPNLDLILETLSDRDADSLLDAIESGDVNTVRDILEI
jgi:hypothetical protein